MSRPDGWDWNISDYTDSHTGQTLYRVSVHDCRQPAACNLSGYATSDAAEAAARKWISDKLGQDQPPTPVLPADGSLSVVEMVARGALATIEALRLSVEHLDSKCYPADRDLMRAVDVRDYRMDLLQRIEDSYRAELDAIRLKRDPDFYLKAKHGD
jgi:hypothetical protein